MIDVKMRTRLVRFPATKKAMDRGILHLLNTSGEKVTNDAIAAKARISIASVYNYRQGLRCPKRDVAFRLGDFFFGADPENSDGSRLKFVTDLLGEGEAEAASDPQEELLRRGGGLILRSSNYRPFAGKANCFLDSLVTRFFQVSNVPTSEEGRWQNIEAKDLSKGDVLVGLWDSLDRVVRYGFRFWRFPVRMTLGACCHIDHKSEIPSIAAALSDPRKVTRHIRPIVVEGEVGSIHCEKRLGYKKAELSAVQKMDEGLLATRLEDETRKRKDTIPVVCVDDLTAMRVRFKLGSKACLVFPMNTPEAIQQKSARRELPLYHLSVAVRSRKPELVQFMDEALGRFLSTEVETTATAWFELAKDLLDKVDEMTRKTSARVIEKAELWAQAWDWVRYTLTLDSKSIDSMSDTGLPFKPILRRARQLLQSYVGHKDNKDLVSDQVERFFTRSKDDAKAQILPEDMRKLCDLFDVQLEPKKARTHIYTGQQEHLAYVLRAALRGKEHAVVIDVYDAAGTDNQIAVARNRELLRGLEGMYQSLGRDGLIAVKRMNRELDDAKSHFGGGNGVFIMAHLEEEPDHFVGTLCLSDLMKGKCELRYLWVDPSFRGSAIGSRLINRAVGFTQNKSKCKAAVIEVLPSLTHAVELFVAAGFGYASESRPKAEGRNVFELKFERGDISSAANPKKP
jgi:ribosomal protein S18 acetylase RimI-like enzyme